MTKPEADEASFVGNLIYDLMLQYYNNDIDKTNAWLTINNPFLGYATPVTLLNSGKHEDLLEYVDKLTAKRDRIVELIKATRNNIKKIIYLISAILVVYDLSKFLFIKPFLSQKFYNLNFFLPNFLASFWSCF